MTTALDVIKRSMRLIEVYAIGEDPTADEAQDGLTALNALLGTYANSMIVYAKTLDVIPLVASQTSVTVGPTGTFVTTRPAKVLNESYIEYQGVSYPLTVLTLQEYNEIGVKANSGIPAGIWVLPNMPDITVTPFPVPSDAMTLNLWSNRRVTAFPTLTTVVTLPDGYEDFLAYMLAEAIAPEYGREPSATVVRLAGRARRALKRTNVEVPDLQMPYGIPAPGYYQDWRTL